MNTHITNPRQFRLFGAVLAMAALLAVLLAVTFAAGPAQAQVTIDPNQLPRTGDNAEEYSDPLPCSEEAKPDNAVGVISDGYYAVFDAFWDYEVGHLSNNFCPPKVTVTTKYDPAKQRNVDVYTRHDADINIRETVFSIPDSYKATVIDTRPGVSNGNPGNIQGDTIDIADFPFLAEGGAVTAVETENGANVFAGNSLWWVRLDQPWTTDVETSPLQIGFSTDLMEEADWYNANGAPVKFRFEAVHVLKDGTLYTGDEVHELGAHFFAFDQRTADTPLSNPRWSNVKTITESEIGMQTDQYQQLQFAFTEPGVYRVQVNVEGYVRKTRLSSAPQDWSPISPDETITSPVQWYTFHVGSEADLHTEVTAGAVETTGGVSTVPITVTATNSGPNGAENVEVDIYLPPGLNDPSAALPAGATYNGCGVVSWKIGAMASGATRTLSFSSTVDPAAAGKHTVAAEIRSTTFDPNTANNAASADTTLSGTYVRPPFFPGVTREIVEHAIAGTHAGDPVAANSPDGRDLTYTLEGRCSDWFQVHPNGQIVLAANKTLDYEKQWEFPLILHVSDGVNASGEADTSYDDSIPVTINVTDTPDNAVHPTVAFTVSDPGGQGADFDIDRPKVQQRVNITASVHNAPSGKKLTYPGWTDDGHYDRWANTNVYHAFGNRVGTVAYSVHVKWPGGGITATTTVEWHPK